eukprot:1574938-Alexandrium_andersonii.AAC.1
MDAGQGAASGLPASAAALWHARYLRSLARISAGPAAAALAHHHTAANDLFAAALEAAARRLRGPEC